jgi:hypothetical protein
MTTIWEKTMLSSLGDHFEKKKTQPRGLSRLMDFGWSNGKVKNVLSIPHPPKKKIRIFRMNFLYCKLGPSSLCSYIQV